jgi:hypothetical protein
VPERALVGYVYIILRPAFASAEGGSLIFDRSGELPWELPAFEFHDVSPYEPAVDLRSARFANGVTIECLEPGLRYACRYEGDRLVAELEFVAHARPLVSRSPDGLHGHVDQMGRVRGRMDHAGETTEIDCFAMRDRGWGPRVYRPGTRYGYAYGASSSGDCFLAVTSRRKDSDRVLKGFLHRDGDWSPLTEGVRTVQRDSLGKPLGVELAARDDAGRELVVSGEVVARQAFAPYRQLVTWDSLVRWRWDGGDAWGEDQDVWHVDAWRAAFAAREGLS